MLSVEKIVKVKSSILVNGIMLKPIYGKILKESIESDLQQVRLLLKSKKKYFYLEAEVNAKVQ